MTAHEFDDAGRSWLRGSTRPDGVILNRSFAAAEVWLMPRLIT